MGFRAAAAALVVLAAFVVAPVGAARAARSSDGSAPAIEGGSYKGATLQCVVPDDATAATYGWLRDDAPVDGAMGSAYLVLGADVDTGLPAGSR